MTTFVHVDDTEVLKAFQELREHAQKALEEAALAGTDLEFIVRQDSK